MGILRRPAGYRRWPPRRPLALFGKAQIFNIDDWVMVKQSCTSAKSMSFALSPACL
jgi:hypothetical protein